eukprot:CAMPEP_0194126908 /NCGR_PEP_ID=MMETSP0150-20130528/60238_1 /TAXON_ID=122233 /ORGANISM="Chaetoceros debilis, Strain MM31A-1" /LENGTH=234 /DNA_ID=CAMNT_0038820795 /DNA_START=762 /DNA_END=1467 /DNA_ORIENTATION=+
MMASSSGARSHTATRSNLGYGPFLILYQRFTFVSDSGLDNVNVKDRDFIPLLEGFRSTKRKIGRLRLIIVVGIRMNHLQQFNQFETSLYIYRGQGRHPCFLSSIAVSQEAFYNNYINLVSVIMDDKVKKIEWSAFESCITLGFVPLFNTLKYIEGYAFNACPSLEALFLPSTVKSIGYEAFVHFRSLLILPDNIDLSNIGDGIMKTYGYSSYCKSCSCGIWVGVRTTPTDERDR